MPSKFLKKEKKPGKFLGLPLKRFLSQIHVEEWSLGSSEAKNFVDKTWLGVARQYCWPMRRVHWVHWVHSRPDARGVHCAGPAPAEAEPRCFECFDPLERMRFGAPEGATNSWDSSNLGTGLASLFSHQYPMTKKLTAAAATITTTITSICHEKI